MSTPALTSASAPPSPSPSPAPTPDVSHDHPMLRRPLIPTPDRRSGSLVPPAAANARAAAVAAASAAATANATHTNTSPMPPTHPPSIPRRFSLRSIKRRSKSRVHDVPDIPPLPPSASPNLHAPHATSLSQPSSPTKRNSLRSSTPRDRLTNRPPNLNNPLSYHPTSTSSVTSTNKNMPVSTDPADSAVLPPPPVPYDLPSQSHTPGVHSSLPPSAPSTPSIAPATATVAAAATTPTATTAAATTTSTTTTPSSPPPAAPNPTVPRPRRMMFFREEGVMRVSARNKERNPVLPPHVDPLALLRNMPVLAEGWLYLSVHAAPGITNGPIAKWMFRRSVVKRYAQLRGNVVLLYMNRTDPVKELFSPVGCAVSSADTVVNRRGAVEHNVNIAKNGFTIQLRLKSEADADLWAAVLRDVSLVRQPRLADFHLIAPIGEGASGKVFLVRDGKTGRKLALKCMSKKGGSFGYSASEFRHAVDERLAHEHMNNADFIVKLRHAFQTKDKLYLATEFCEGGDVYNFVDMRGGGVSEDQARIVTAQVLLGLKALHQESIVFRDLKPENVLLDRDGRVQLADFGLCKMLDASDALTRTVCGTFSYAASEILEENGYGLSCDLWALGIFLYHIMIGRPPRVAASLQEARDNIFNSKEPIIWFSDVMSEVAMSLVTGLIEVDPGRRLGCGPSGIDEICSHAFFKGVDWVALEEGDIPPYVTQELPPAEQGDLRNFNQEEWRSIRMDADQDCPAYTESVLWPLRNLATHPLPRDFLVSYSYSCETMSGQSFHGLVMP